MARVRQRGERDYLQLRNGVYQLRFQYPDPTMRHNALLFYGLDPETHEWPKEERRSLKTRIRAEAEAKAAPYIERHRRFLAFHAALTDTKRSWGDLVYFRQMEPNTQKVLDNGTRLVADEEKIMVIEPNGTIHSRPNGVRGGIRVNVEAFKQEQVGRDYLDDFEAMRVEAAKDKDGEAIEAYAKTLNLRDDEKLTMRVFRKVKAFVENKPIRECTRFEVIRFIVDELSRKAKGEPDALSHPRLKKGMRYVAAAVKHSKDHDEHSPFRAVENPFAAIPWNNERVIPAHVEQPLDAFSEEDVDVIVRNLHLLGDEARLMMVAHIATGVRPVGLGSINKGGWISETETDGSGRVLGQHRTRYWDIADDKDREGNLGPRFIAVPQAVIDLKRKDGTPLVPAEFEGSLFKLDHESIGKACNKFLKQIGVSPEKLKEAPKGSRKSLYSGRHRARSRYEAVGCPDAISEHIMGHAESKKKDARRKGSTSHRGYGGHYAYVLKRWSDHVGCAALQYAEAAE